MNAKDLLHLSLDYELKMKWFDYEPNEALNKMGEKIDALLDALELSPKSSLINHKFKTPKGEIIEQPVLVTKFDYFFKGHFLDSRDNTFYDQNLYDEIVHTVKLLMPIPLEKEDFQVFRVINMLYKRLFKYRLDLHPFTVEKELVFYGFMFGPVYSVHLQNELSSSNKGKYPCS